MNVGPDLWVDGKLQAFVEDELLPGLDIAPGAFWGALTGLFADFTPRNAELLRRRDDLQAGIDAWWRDHRGSTPGPAEQADFLRAIGYLAPEPEDVAIVTSGVDEEIATLAAPQLVVPVSNARYALNAANARWGSLYDALYGTDALAPPTAGAAYDPGRGAAVVAYARRLLDRIAPLATGSHAEAVGYAVTPGGLSVRRAAGEVPLAAPEAFAGWRGDADAPQAVLLRHHGLHVEVCIDRAHPIGRADPAGVADLEMEAALTTIQDCEDSVAAVDAADKVCVYRNWLGLMRGDLEARFLKDGRVEARRLAEDRRYSARGGGELTLPGRSLMLVRNVGHHMTIGAARFRGQDAFETVLDALVTVAAALHDLHGARRNSRAGAIYVVKPKLHGPDEVALAVRLFDQVEGALGLPRNTVKLGVMDEERRTSLNLKACIHAARDRIVFVNTGFLDRTGDEIRTAMEAGPVVRKADMAAQPWLDAYERRNVAAALAAGFRGRAQIGKGMWAAPDRMAAMLAAKAAQLTAGASTAWVPSPTAAVLHALHYHEVDVAAAQAQVAAAAAPALEALLVPPLTAAGWSAAEVQQELDNNVQGVLGYVVRWIDAGVGCSKIPDIHAVGLMEDRATLRISSQHVANWLHHGVVSEAQVRATLLRMAAMVDAQNREDPAYRPLGGAPEASHAFQASLELLLDGRKRPNGYTEPVLQRHRLAVKARSDAPAVARPKRRPIPEEMRT